jgi:ribosomal protein RSM22 (predicted rRNA methylase)
VSPELPPALRAAVAAELEGASRHALATRAAATSTAYRAGGTSAAAIRGRDDALAYALARMPATYAAAARVFGEALDRAPGFAPATLLDAGCGPGGATWAAREAWPSLADIAWFDASGPFLDLAQRLAGEAFAARTLRGDLAAGPFPEADLVVASYALAEIDPAGQGRVVDGLWAACGGLLALIEPGTPAGTARLLAARERLIAAGAAILAPCPHHGACPLAAPDWCHFSVRLPRSRDHRLVKSAEVPFEDEKYAYLLAARPGVGQAAAGRIVGPPRASKPGLEFKVCGPEGLERRFAPKRDRPQFAQARRRTWGEAWP